jgi:hypothetical protein
MRYGGSRSFNAGIYSDLALSTETARSNSVMVPFSDQYPRDNAIVISPQDCRTIMDPRVRLLSMTFFNPNLGFPRQWPSLTRMDSSRTPLSPGSGAKRRRTPPTNEYGIPSAHQSQTSLPSFKQLEPYLRPQHMSTDHPPSYPYSGTSHYAPHTGSSNSRNLHRHPRSWVPLNGNRQSMALEILK